MVRVEDVRAHCEHARENGASILMEPTDFEYGERQYSAEDLAGHQWTFSETIAGVAPRNGAGNQAVPIDRSVGAERSLTAVVCRAGTLSDAEPFEADANEQVLAVPIADPHTQDRRRARAARHFHPRDVGLSDGSSVGDSES